MSGHRCLVTNCTCLFIFTPNSTYVCWDSSQPVPASVRNCVKHEAGFASSSLVWGSGTVVVGWLRSGLWRVDILSWFSLWGRHSFSSVLVTFLSHWTSSSTTVTVPIKLFPLLSCVWARISQALCKVSERLLRTYMLGWNKTSAHVISLLRSRRTCWGQAALPHLNGRLIITFSLDQQISPATLQFQFSACFFLCLPSILKSTTVYCISRAFIGTNHWSQTLKPCPTVSVTTDHRQVQYQLTFPTPGFRANYHV